MCSIYIRTHSQTPIHAGTRAYMYLDCHVPCRKLYPLTTCTGCKKVLILFLVTVDHTSASGVLCVQEDIDLTPTAAWPSSLHCLAFARTSTLQSNAVDVQPRECRELHWSVQQLSLSSATRFSKTRSVGRELVSVISNTKK